MYQNATECSNVQKNSEGLCLTSEKKQPKAFCMRDLIINAAVSAAFLEQSIQFLLTSFDSRQPAATVRLRLGRPSLNNLA